MIDDNTRRIQIPDGEVRELTSHDGLLWERAVSEIKGRLEAAYVTRDNGIQHLKAFGGTAIKHKAEALWGKYVPCEYIESSGTQYIDTGIKITSDDEVYLDGCVTDSNSTFLLSQGLSSNNQAYQLANTASNELVFDIQSYDTYRVNTHISALNTITKIHIKNREIFVDGVSKGTSNGTLINPTETAKLMYSVSGVSAQKVKIAKFTVVGKCDFIPVKDVVNNVYGMWDRVTETFYGNAGTGAFTGGELIQPISYAESDGTAAYCDTGIVPTTFDYTITYEGAIKKLTSGPNCAWGYMGSSGNLPRWICATYNNKYLVNANTTSQIDITADTNNHTFVGKIYEDNGVAKWSSEIDGVVKQDDKAFVSANTWEANTLSIYLFARHNVDGAGNFAPATLKRWICEKNGVVIKHLIPVRIGTTVELLDLVNWQFATRTGTFTAGADIPLSQIVPDVIEVNTGDLKYGQYGNKYGIFTDGTHKVKLSKDGTQIAERNIPMLLSEDSFVDIQTGNKSEAWGIKVLDGTESEWTDASTSDKGIFYVPIIGRSLTIKEGLCSHFDFSSVTSSQAPDGSMFYYSSSNIGFRKDGMTLAEFKSWLASEYAAGHPVIILYPLATPITDQVTIAPIASARRTTYVADSESELGKLNLELQFLGK